MFYRQNNPLFEVKIIKTAQMEAKIKISIDPNDLEMVAFNSNKKTRARNAVLAVDAAMQENHSALKSELIGHLSPVIVVQNDGQGGMEH